MPAPNVQEPGRASPVSVTEYVLAATGRNQNGVVVDTAVNAGRVGAKALVRSVKAKDNFFKRSFKLIGYTN